MSSTRNVTSTRCRHSLTYIASVTLLAVFTSFVVAPVAAEPLPVDWSGAEGETLPFQTEEELVDFLETAPIIKSKRLSSGINRALKVTLERDGVRANAVFKSVDVSVSNNKGSTRPDRWQFRDSHIFEVAAYRLSKMLNLHRVPPTVFRQVNGEEGTLQLWVENSNTEAGLIMAGKPTGPMAQHQRQMTLVFDNLIYNFDRHQDNILFDRQGRLWMIDHTRSFKRLPKLRNPKKIAVCERTLYEGIRDLDPEQVRAELGDVLGKIEINALLKRRELLMERLDQLIAERGAEAVLFDLPSQVEVGFKRAEIERPSADEPSL